MPATTASSAADSETVRAPKMSTGMDSGSIRRLSRAVPRCRPTVSAAPTEPSRLRLIVPNASVFLYRDLDGDGVLDSNEPLIGSTVSEWSDR